MAPLFLWLSCISLSLVAAWAVEDDECGDEVCNMQTRSTRYSRMLSTDPGAYGPAQPNLGATMAAQKPCCDADPTKVIEHMEDAGADGFVKLGGTWQGTGLNYVALPDPNDSPFGNVGFSFLNMTMDETLTFELIAAEVLNRGLKDPKFVTSKDMDNQVVAGFQYKTKVYKTGTDALIHEEAGQTMFKTHAAESEHLPWKVMRMGSIAHGSQIMAVGPLSTTTGSVQQVNTSWLAELDSLLNVTLNVLPSLSAPGDNASDDVDCDIAVDLGPHGYYRDCDELCRDPVKYLMKTSINYDTEVIINYTSWKMTTMHNEEYGGTGILNSPFINKQAKVTQFNVTFFLLNVQDKLSGNVLQVLQYVQNMYLVFLPSQKITYVSCPKIQWPHVQVNSLRRSDSPLPPAQPKVWAKYANLNCYGPYLEHGADCIASSGCDFPTGSDPDAQGVSLQECMDICSATLQCHGIVVDSQSSPDYGKGKCWLRTRITLDQCDSKEKATDHDTWVLDGQYCDTRESTSQFKKCVKYDPPSHTHNWVLREGVNCYPGVGGDTLGGDVADPFCGPGDPTCTFNACFSECAVYNRGVCQGVVVQEDGAAITCWLRKNIDIPKCDRSDPSYNMWVLDGK